MPDAIRSTLTLALLALFLTPGLAQDRPAAPARTVQDLAFLAGRWKGEMTVKAGDEVVEGPSPFAVVYTDPAGGMVLSTSKGFDDAGAVDFFEFEVFTAREGKVMLTPYPGGEEAESFELTQLDPAARKAVFESPENEWPTRIEYARTADDRLVIEAAGDQDGQRVVLRLELRRE